MALGCHEAWKGADGAADAAWNDAGSSSSTNKFSTIIPSSSLTRGARQSKAGTSVGGSRGSHSKGVSHSVAAEADGTTGCVILEIPPALILEIFLHLGARDLSVVACVCSTFRRLASDSHGWKDFYCERWGPPVPAITEGPQVALPGKHWRELYVAKESRSKAMMGRFTMDMLHGHTAAVRAVRLLPPANLVCTGGYDQTVRIWNLEEGLPIACSRTLGETIRAIAVDMNMLAVGGSDCVVRVWHAKPECPHRFDVAGVLNPSPSRVPETVLCGHTGPVTCLGLDSSHLYSGSWDMSIKAWSRTTLKCTRNFRHMDWVWALARRGGRILSTAGSDVYTWDAETGRQLRLRTGVHSGQAYAVEGTRSGHIVFTGGEDGGVRMFDDRISRKKSMADANDDAFSGLKEAVASWTPHASAVYSLAFDDPWLVSASGDGILAMMDVRQIIKRATGNSKHSLGGGSARWRRSGQYLVSKEGDTAQRRLSGFHHSSYSVDVAADRVVSGGNEKIVRIWDFSQALENERRVQASRSSQIEHRLRRKQQHLLTMAGITESKEPEAKEGDEMTTNEDAEGMSSTANEGHVDGGRRKGMTRLGTSGRNERDKGHKEGKNLVILGTSGKSPVRTAPPGLDFMKTRARYLDHVSVPS